MSLGRPFIRLPFAFDAQRLAREAEDLPAGAWMPHPTGQRGNAAVALISRDGGDNDDFQGWMRPTAHLLCSEYHQQVMAAFGEVLGRSRLMKLAAGSEVGLHVDFNYHWHSRVRVHVPVITNPHVGFHCGDETVHMDAGECWLFDNWRRHNVVNAGTTDRIHLVIDLAGSSRFWRLVREAAHLDPHRDARHIDAAVHRVPHRPGARADVATERYNTAPVMAPGEVDALVGELIRDFSAHPGNEPVLVDRYSLLLSDFARDWRDLWHRFGISRAGVPHYRSLLEGVATRLDPRRRALITASNGVGVNPVIVQRILRPALAPAMFDHFREPPDVPQPP